MSIKVVVTCVLALQGILAAEWGYSGRHGPSHWNEIAQTCGQKQQSPINIFEGDVKELPEGRSLQFRNYDTSNGVTMTLRNNGHSAAVALGGNTEITVSGGGLPEGPFRALQFHFHWGSDSDTGSEHLISTKAYPMEVHFVHVNTKYSNLTAALKENDGLAVLGFMFEVSNEDNRNYDVIVNNLLKIQISEGQTDFPAVPLNSLLPETFTNFYRYSGSLTTPSCQESVTWTVFKETIKLSEDQLQKFRTLRDSHNHLLVNNYRPVQDLNSRTVFASFKPDIHWGYSEGHLDASHWKHYYSNCNGQSQSPINISTEHSQLDARIASFNFHNYDRNTGMNMRLINNGHTVQVDFTAGDISISGGGLSEVYQAAKLQFHWGSSDMKGSEHTLDHHAYPMEVHIVHFKKSLRNLMDSVTVPEGLAVLGVFFEISTEDNPALKVIIDNLGAIQVPGSNTTIRAINLNSFLPQDKDSFFRYNGSLTTPGCFQTVIWTVFKETIKISRSQLAALRRLKSAEKDASGNSVAMVDNFRPVQDHNNRIVLRTFAVTTPSKTHWSYEGDHGHVNWYKDYPTCDDQKSDSRQSPINIEPAMAKYTDIGQLRFSNYSLTTGVTMQIKNNGHTAQIDITGANIDISGGGLEGTYRAAQLHFHWGANSKRGSEHFINGYSLPMEVHIVHYNIIYPDLVSAVSQSNGLAVLGFMFQVTKEDNKAYDVIIKKLNEIKNPNSKASIQTFSLASILPKDVTEFYRYDGSLTTPGCMESVTWTVFKSFITISEDQLSKFRSMLSNDEDKKSGKHNPLVDNFRPPQKLNNRVVQVNFVATDTSTTILARSTILIISMVAVLKSLIC